MNYSFDIDHKQEIIRYKHSGLIERKELGKAWMDILSLDEFVNKGYGLLTDYRDSKFNFTIDDTDEIWTFLKQNEKILRNKCEAILIDNPENTVITFLFEVDLYDKVGFLVKTFSTEEAALDWLNINVRMFKTLHNSGK